MGPVIDDILEKHAFAMEAYKDFRDLCDSLRFDRGLTGEGFGDDHSLGLSPASEELEIDREPEPEEEENRYLDFDYLKLWGEDDGEGVAQDKMMDFPEVQGFSIKDINPEDPAFAYGKSIGIPVGLVVRTDDGDKLLPIIDGKFNGYGL